ncbi:MAG: nucleoside hydrolase [Gammaproteobacteria bacterium]|nr:nucleoside hydrolase [Gammaproteobacteria bacterium]MCH9744743.1 nucleoside hydrolase [Gammaproteobacteria bacterium]
MSKQSFIIDTDVDFDDLLAIYWLLMQKDADIKLITHVGNGWSSSQQGLKNLLNALAYFGCEKIPVAAGAKRSLSTSESLPDELIQLTDDLWGIELPQSHNQAMKVVAPQAIIDTLKEAQEPVKIVAIGPLTNIAMAMVQAPEICDNIAAIYVTGGNAHEAIKESSFAGNERHDIVSARIVYSSGAKIISLPSKTFHHFGVDDPLLDPLHKAELKEVGEFIRSLIKLPAIQQGHSASLYMWDVLTAFVAYHDLKHSVLTPTSVNIREEAVHDSDLIYSDEKGYPIHEISEIDKEIFYKLFLETILSEDE